MAHLVFAAAVAVGYLAFSLPASGADAAAWCAVISGSLVRRDQWWQVLGLPISFLGGLLPNVLGGNRG